MEDFLNSEVEDIMCDQVIISTELDVFDHESAKVSVRKVRFAVTLIAKSVLPTVVGIYYAYLRNQKTVVERFRRNVLPTIVAFLANSISRSLSSVQRGITYPLSITYKESAETSDTVEDDQPEKSVECLVLTNPEEITADVIFIHGLHGSLFNTWRQGTWRHVNHQLRKRSLEKGLPTGDSKNGVRKISLKRSSSAAFSGCPNKISKTDEQCNFVNMQNEQEDSEGSTIEGCSKCWPQDWLPVDCPGARVIALNYTTDPYLWRPVWIKKRNRTSMTERSKEMIEHLLKLGVGEHPIIWVGHSKGGLFVKQIIIDAWESIGRNVEWQGIYDRTKAVMFYSVPHKGSLLADVTLPLLKRSVELTEIQRNCPFVLDLHRKFLDILHKSSINPEIFSFIETSFTFMSFIYLKIVAFESADPGVGFTCGVPLDHREICKPAGRDCFLYQELVKLIQNAVANTS